MKKTRNLFFVLVLALTVGMWGCGRGGGGTPTAEDIDGDGVPNLQDPFPSDATRFTAFGAPRVLEGVAGSGFATAVSINNNRQVVGMSDNAGQEMRAVIWNVSADGTPSPAAELHPIAGNSYSAAYGIGDSGVAVGESAKGADYVAVLWPASSQTPSELSLGDLATPAAAYGINAGNGIVGEATRNGKVVPVYWTSPTAVPVQLPLLGGGTTGTAYFIDAAGGKIVGESENSGGRMRAVLWKVEPDGTVGNPTDLGVLSGHDRSAAFGINGSGYIVGESENGSGEVRAVLWSETSLLGIPTGFKATDLGSPGTRSAAFAINDLNIIAGWRDAPGSLASLWHALNALNVSPAVSNTAFDSTSFTQAYGINGAGIVVGLSADRGFVAVPQGNGQPLAAK